MSGRPYDPELPLKTGPDGRSSGPAIHRQDDFRPKLPQFRFGLRQFFYFVTGLSGVMAVLVSWGGLPALVFTVAVLVVAAHVFSTALGSRLRAEADSTRVRGDQADFRGGGMKQTMAADSARRLPPCSPLFKRRTDLRWVPILILCGSVLGALAGAVVVEVAIGQPASITGVAIGAVSTAILGGWAAFLGGNFYGIARQVWSEALTEQRKDEARRTGHGG